MKRFVNVLIFCLSGLLGCSVMAAGEPINTLGCILEPSKRLKISSPVPSVIEALPVDRGQRIKKGDLLFELQSGIQKAAVNLAEVKAGFASRNKERNANLYGEDLLSSHERDEIETEYLVAKMELEAAQEELALRKVYSTVSGVITDKHNSEGEYVTTEPVLELAVLNPLNVEVLMPFELFREYRVGSSLTVTLPAPVSGSYPAKIVIIDPIIDSASGTFRMRLELSNRDYKIPAGVACELSN